MKTLIDAMLALASYSKEKHIETELVSIESLISFILKNYPLVTGSNFKRNIAFILQTYDDNYKDHDRLLLKQAFKLISDRLTERDRISIVSYEKYNGILLEWISAKQCEKLLYAIEHPIPRNNFLGNNVIEFANNKAKQQFKEYSIVVISTIKSHVASNTDKSLYKHQINTTDASTGLVF